MKAEKKLNKSQIYFDPILTCEQKMTCVNELILSGLDFSSMPGLNITIGTFYRLNDDGSIQIPWNWFENQ
jgi:hypothetical protein